MNNWAVFYKNRKLFWASVIALAPVILFGDYFGLGSYFFFGWALLVLFPLGINFIMTDCPNCKNSILYKGYASPLSNKCLYCGIKIGDPKKDE